MSDALMHNTTLRILGCELLLHRHSSPVTLHACSLNKNPIGQMASRAIAQGIDANRNSALTWLDGVRLCDHLSEIDVSDDYAEKSNELILGHLHSRPRLNTVKSARGGAR
jgi:hypothetical protein